jgi:hypothetical protein
LHGWREGAPTNKTCLQASLPCAGSTSGPFGIDLPQCGPAADFAVLWPFVAASQGKGMSRYSLDQLKQRLGAPGWRTVTGNKSMPHEGTLGELTEAAHDRHKNGKAVGYLQEIETKIEVDLMQLEELWLHLGLPTI